MNPVVAVVVPTRNRPTLLADTLSSLLAQVFKEPYEVIVVDDGSEPSVRVPDGIHLIRHDGHRGLNAARNAGARAARSDLVLYVDDDVEFPPGWLAAFVKGTERHPTALCFGGPMRVRVEDIPRGACPICARWANECDLDLGSCEGETSTNVWGGNMGIRKTSLERVGMFDEERPIHFEEFEWQDRLRSVKAPIVYLPEAWLWHRRTPENMAFRGGIAKSFRRGRGEAFYRLENGLPLDVGDRMRHFLGLLLHACRRRCTAALWLAVSEVGAVAGVIAFLRIRPRPVVGRS